MTVHTKPVYRRRRRRSSRGSAAPLLLLLCVGALRLAEAGDAGVKLATLVQDGSIEHLAAYLAAPGADINARPNARPNEDKALLDYAAEQNQVEVATWLLDHGANVNAAQQRGLQAGLTALHRAAYFDSFELAELLIARGADVNANRSSGATPLFFASSAGHARMVELLLKDGADVAVKAPAGTTAASAAAQHGHLDILKVLEAHGASLTDDRPLSEAVVNQHADIVRYLLDRGQSQVSKDSALRFAVLAADRRTDGASLDLVSTLIEAGANVNDTGTAAVNTPLMMANRPELRRLLLDHGALDLVAVRAEQAKHGAGDPAARASAPPPGLVAAVNADRLGRIVQTLGGDGPVMRGQSFDMFAALQMHMIAPDDPNWNRSNPRWVALFNTVKEDLRRDAEPALAAELGDARHVLATTLASRLSTDEVARLLAFYHSDEGLRYIAFESRLGDIQTQGMAQLTGAMIGAARPALGDTPSQELLNARRRALKNSWTSLVVPEALSSGMGDPGGSQQPGAASVFDAMLDVIARTHGQEIDALENQYAADLPQFDRFQHSPEVSSLRSAMKAVFQEAAAHPQSVDQFKAALDGSIARHLSSWKAAYEAGHSSASRPQEKAGPESLAPLVAMGQLAAAMEAQQPSVLKPGDADYPEEATHPAQVVSVIVSGRDHSDMRVMAEYVSDVKLCGHQIGLGGYFPYTLTFPVAMAASGDTYRGSFAVDRFRPGKCGWQCSSLGYGLVDGQQNAIVRVSDRADASPPEGELWCYRVTYENKAVHSCESLGLLKWSNAIRAVSPEFLSRFSHQQLNDSPGTGMTSQTREIHVALHDLNSMPGALIPVGDQDAQAARAKAEMVAAQQTPEYQAIKCVSDMNFEYVQSHKPLPDTATQQAALAEIKQTCRAKFGLPPLPPLDAR